MKALIEAMIDDGKTPPGIIEDALKDADPNWEEGSPLATVYIVQGWTGQNCDQQSEWGVAAFLDEAKAERLASDLNEWCKDNGVHMNHGGRRIAGLACPLEPNFYADDTGTLYSIAAVDLMG
jgi:hypothetical protein